MPTLKDPILEKKRLDALREAMKKPRSEEWLRNQREGRERARKEGRLTWKGTPAQLAAIKKMQETNRGKKRPIHVTEIVRKANLGLKRTKEVCLKLSESMKAQFSSGARVHPKFTDPNWLKKIIEGRKANPWHPSLEQKMAHSKKLKGRLPSSEIVKKRADPMRGRPQTAELTKKGITNQNCKIWHLRDPSGVDHKFKNLREFVETHIDMFAAEDLIRKPYLKNMKTCKSTILGSCNAVKRLSQVGSRAHPTWKGWTKVSEEEKFYNEGNDLLNRTLHIPSSLK